MLNLKCSLHSTQGTTGYETANNNFNIHIECCESQSPHQRFRLEDEQRTITR